MARTPFHSFMCRLNHHLVMYVVPRLSPVILMLVICLRQFLSYSRLPHLLCLFARVGKSRAKGCACYHCTMAACRPPAVMITPVLTYVAEHVGQHDCPTTHAVTQDVHNSRCGSALRSALKRSSACETCMHNPGAPIITSGATQQTYPWQPRPACCPCTPRLQRRSAGVALAWGWA